jgi:hypothetical protein
MGRTGLFRTAAAAAIAVAGTLTIALPGTAASAGLHPRVSPHQVFEGLVNGKPGVPDAVTVFVACHGPAQMTGHPLGTVEVLPAPSTAGDNGNTGDTGTSIVAFFAAPPPAAHAASVATAARRTTVTFYRYGVAKPMPKGVDVPCSGTGQVTFIAFPRTPPTSRAAVVPVHYEPEP